MAFRADYPHVHSWILEVTARTYSLFALDLVMLGQFVYCAAAVCSE